MADLSRLTADQLAEKVRGYRNLAAWSVSGEPALAELGSRLKTAYETVDELETELADERTLHQVTLRRLKTAEDALKEIANDAALPASIARRCLAAIRPNPKP